MLARLSEYCNYQRSIMDAADPGEPASAAPIFPAGIVQDMAFDDFDAMAAAPRAWDQHYLKLTRGPFLGTVHGVHTSALQIGTVSWSSGILVTGSVPRGATTFALVGGPGGLARSQGTPVQAGQIVAASDRDELNFMQPQGCEIICLSLAHELLDQASATLLGEPWRDVVPRTPVLTVRDATGLAARIRRLEAVARSQAPGRLADPAFGRRLEEEAAEMVAAQVASVQPRRVPSAQRWRLARRAEDYLRANESRRVGIAELCAAVGAPERTLHHAFRDYFGLPPIAYLRVRRLHLARGQLRERGRETTVTTTATDWGFDHLGEFATAYRHLFGETPSQTLRRQSFQLRRGDARNHAMSAQRKLRTIVWPAQRQVLE